MRQSIGIFSIDLFELSKHGVCINPIPAAISIARSGWFSVSTSILNYFFVADLAIDWVFSGSHKRPCNSL